MSEYQILRAQMDVMLQSFAHLARHVGSRLTRTEMCHRLGISGKTLTDRVRRGVVPSPATDGKWLLSEVIEWESRQATSNV